MAKKNKRENIDRDNDIEDGRPIPGIKYLCFPGGSNRQDVIQRYKDVNDGKSPSNIFFNKRLIWAGPIDQSEVENDVTNIQE